MELFLKKKSTDSFGSTFFSIYLDPIEKQTTFSENDYFFYPLPHSVLEVEAVCSVVDPVEQLVQERSLPTVSLYSPTAQA